MTNPSRAVLVTGCAAGTNSVPGTGRATALRLHRAGWSVYATGRDLDALDELAALGINTLRVDMADPDSMEAAVSKITAEHGAVGALVNNAAQSLIGTVEETPIELVREQFEVNVFGLSRLTQLVLPGMRAQGAGRIVMLSSLFGLFSTAGRGYYQATKHALEALSDSLRIEVSQFGIKVVVIEPSPIRGRAVPESVAALQLAPEGQTGAYDELWPKFVKFHEPYRHLEASGRGRLATSVDEVARVIETAITSPKPRVRYKIGPAAKMVPRMRWSVGEQRWDRLVRVLFPAP
jgi:NAD(P)-dependent dehydrogenase (short-subunit alcohol dehydrogenase family)